MMADTAIDIRSSHREELDGSHTVTLTISGLPSLGWAQLSSDWLRDLVRNNASQIGRLDHKRSEQ